MATVAPQLARGGSFYQRMAVGLALFILFAFAQFSARGFVDIGHVPTIVHVHAMAMTAWLGLFVAQAALAQRLDLKAHRVLGWTSLLLIGAIPPLALGTALAMLRLHAIPPFFTPGGFLALVTVEAAVGARCVH